MTPREWLTILLYGTIIVFGIVTLYRWHTSEEYKSFCLLDLIAERGRISSRKFMEFGAWIVASAAIILTVIRGTLDTGMLIAYLGSFVAARSVGQWMNLRSDTEIRKASIARGVSPPLGERRSEPRDQKSVEGPHLTVEEEDELRRAEVATIRTK